MRRYVPLSILAALMVLGIVTIQNATKNRVDEATDGTWTEIEFVVSLPGGAVPDMAVAQRLWSVCQGTLPDDVSPDDAIPAGPGTFTARVEPALGSNGWRRVKGCLNDATLDRVKSQVVGVVQTNGVDLGV